MLRALARPLLASWFVYRGVSDVLDPAPRAQEVEDTVGVALEALELETGTQIPTKTLIQVHGAATALAAATLALSKTPRTAAAALAGLAAVTAATSAPFWRMHEGPERDAALEKFLINLSLVGGVALAATAGHSAAHVKRVKAQKATAKDKAAKRKAAEAAKKLEAKSLQKAAKSAQRKAAHA